MSTLNWPNDPVNIVDVMGAPFIPLFLGRYPVIKRGMGECRIRTHERTRLKTIRLGMISKNRWKISGKTPADFLFIFPWQREDI
ncbi:hypothetical protein ABB05_15180 [Lederbergia galactosidilytica]|uniref:Uncharacterized protein n=1 Tax=Lederbergia galactosidilytica TaxID=217031 RepID=A0A177ZM66_9BACI|nr:hypothetical protein ABB05_15180 [Lederbergia galactosidilytica]